MWVTWDHLQWTVLQFVQCCYLYTPTHTNAFQFMHTINTHTSHTHTSLTTQIQCCKRSNWLETITNGLCSNVSNVVVCTSNTHSHTHKYSITLTQTHTFQHCCTHHTSLTAQRQCCKWCEWLETITNALCSNLCNGVSCTSTNAFNYAYNQHTPAYTTHHSQLKYSVVSDVSDLRPPPMDCAPMCPMLFPVHRNTFN